MAGLSGDGGSDQVDGRDVVFEASSDGMGRRGGHCCVVRSRGALIGSNAVAGSDHHGEFVERGCHSEMPVAGVDTELVVAATQVLDERVSTDHH